MSPPARKVILLARTTTAFLITLTKSVPNYFQVVLVSQDAYDALYHAQDRLDDEYEPRALSRAPSRLKQPQLHEAPKQPPVQTIRNYNKVGLKYRVDAVKGNLNRGKLNLILLIHNN